MIRASKKYKTGVKSKKAYYHLCNGIFDHSIRIERVYNEKKDGRLKRITREVCDFFDDLISKF